MKNGTPASRVPEHVAETQRLAVLTALEVLDTEPEEEFDTIVHAARTMLDCKIALVSLVDDHRQWFKAKCGIDAVETPKEQAFCAHAVAADALLVVPDALEDSRFADNPLVLGPPYIRFYAGMPIHATSRDDEHSSYPIGTLCVIDDKPRDFTKAHEESLRRLARLVESFLSARSSACDALKVAEERRQMLHRLDLSHRQFHQAERLANIGSWRMMLEDRATEWSDHVFAIHELPVGAMPGIDRALDFYPPQARAVVTAALARTIETGEPMDIETDFLTARGALRRVRSLGELEIKDGIPIAVVGVFQDITKYHDLEQALRRSAQIDDLTRIANRARFNQYADEEIASARERGDTLALLLLDLDNFKSVNDRCGHLAGDELLRFMAAKLRAPYLNDCFAARLGGDEFVLMVPGHRAKRDLTGLVGRLLHDLRQSVPADGGEILVSATIGVSWLENSVRDRSELLHRADTALYEAKRAQRGSAAIFGTQGLITAEDTGKPGRLRAVR
jgi:diguanylate cyclase (GGDEF)-like protein